MAHWILGWRVLLMKCQGQKRSKWLLMSTFGIVTRRKKKSKFEPVPLGSERHPMRSAVWVTAAEEGPSAKTVSRLDKGQKGHSYLLIFLTWQLRERRHSNGTYKKCIFKLFFFCFPCFLLKAENTLVRPQAALLYYLQRCHCAMPLSALDVL